MCKKKLLSTNNNNFGGKIPHFLYPFLACEPSKKKKENSAAPRCLRSLAPALARSDHPRDPRVLQTSVGRSNSHLAWHVTTPPQSNHTSSEIFIIENHQKIIKRFNKYWKSRTHHKNFWCQHSSSSRATMRCPMVSPSCFITPIELCFLLDTSNYKKYWLQTNKHRWRAPPWIKWIHDIPFPTPSSSTTLWLFSFLGFLSWGLRCFSKCRCWL